MGAGAGVLPRKAGFAGDRWLNARKGALAGARGPQGISHSLDVEAETLYWQPYPPFQGRLQADPERLGGHSRATLGRCGTRQGEG